MKKILLSLALLIGIVTQSVSALDKTATLKDVMNKGYWFHFTVFGNDVESSANSNPVPVKNFTGKIVQKTDGNYYLTNFLGLGDVQLYQGSGATEIFFGTYKPSGSTCTLNLSDGSTVKWSRAQSKSNGDGSYTYTYNSNTGLPAFFSVLKISDNLTTNAVGTIPQYNGPFVIRIEKGDEKTNYVIEKIEVRYFVSNLTLDTVTESGSTETIAANIASDQIFNYPGIVSSARTAKVNIDNSTQPKSAYFTYVSGNNGDMYKYQPQTLDGRYTNINSFDLTATPKGNPYTVRFASAEDPNENTRIALEPLSLSVTATKGWIKGIDNNGSVKCSSSKATASEAAIYHVETGAEAPTLAYTIGETTFNYGGEVTYTPTFTYNVDYIHYRESGADNGMFAKVTVTAKNANVLSDFTLMAVPGVCSKVDSQSSSNTPSTHIFTADSNLGIEGAATGVLVKAPAEIEALEAANPGESPVSKTFIVKIPFSQFETLYGQGKASQANVDATFFTKFTVKGKPNQTYFNSLTTQELGNVTGIEAIEAVEEDVPAVYYNLQGVRVENPERGVFIQVKGNKVSKIVR